MKTRIDTLSYRSSFGGKLHRWVAKNRIKLHPILTLATKRKIKFFLFCSRKTLSSGAVSQYAKHMLDISDLHFTLNISRNKKIQSKVFPPECLHWLLATGNIVILMSMAAETVILNRIVIWYSLEF